MNNSKPTGIPPERICASTSGGLSSDQVALRKSQSKTNYVRRTVGKSYFSIFADNLLTAFNLLGLLVFIMMIVAQSWSNIFFYVVISINTFFGVGQEIRAKLVLQRMTLMTASSAHVVRDGTDTEIPVGSLVLDDIIILSPGRQIPADCLVLEGLVEVNESLLTGESLPLTKKPGAMLLSGSFVVSGNCRARVEHVGRENYVEKLSAAAKKYKKPRSVLMRAIGAIIKTIALAAPLLALGTFLTGLLTNGLPWQEALEKAGGAMIGMIPSGMVLLTTVTLAVSVIKMARNKALVQDLYSVEMLARVDILCLDKTGTLTDGTMNVEQLVPLDDGTADAHAVEYKRLILEVLAATGDDNDTAAALKRFANGTPEPQVLRPAQSFLSFSSARKYCAAEIEGKIYAIGAPEFILKNGSMPEEIAARITDFASQGLRPVLLAVCSGNVETLTNIEPLCLAVLSDIIRPDAGEIIGYFKENDVQVKIISGDNALSVSAIARRVGVPNAEKYISLENYTPEQAAALAEEYCVFGRVNPEQKAALVAALKKAGHTVAMTGDGVNDILAMREADCAIAVACGSEAARSVAHIVLTDNSFSCMPKVVREGRQVVNNIQYSSSLFLMKTSMTLVTTILMLILGLTYPLAPRNLYVIEACVIGLPAFLLAIRTNSERIRGSFIKKTLARTAPNAVIMPLSVMLVYAFAKTVGADGNDGVLTSLCMICMTYTGIISLWAMCFPYSKFKLAVCIGSLLTTTALFAILVPVLALAAPDSPFIVPLSQPQIILVVCILLACTALCAVGRVITGKIDKKLNEETER